MSACQVWSLDISGSAGSGVGANGVRCRLVTGSGDSQLRVWRLRGDKSKHDGKPSPPTLDQKADTVGATGGRDGANGGSVFVPMGSIFRKTCTGRAAEVRFSPEGSLLGCLAAGVSVEVYRMCSSKEVVRKVKRRLRRAREKARVRAANLAKLRDDCTAGGDYNTPVARDDTTVSVAAAELEWVATVRCSAKVRSFSFARVLPGRCVAYSSQQGLQMGASLLSRHFRFLDFFFVLFYFVRRKRGIAPFCL